MDSTSKAVEQYDKFLLIMKDADTRIKEVDEARERSAELKKSKL